MFGARELADAAMKADYAEPPPPSHRHFHFHMRGKDSFMADEQGVTHNEKLFMYFLALSGFLAILWIKRQTVSETRKRITVHLKEIDRTVGEDNWVQVQGTSVGQY